MLRILVIEDTQSVREEIATLLRFEGFDVLEAENGEAGARLAMETTPDLVICDILMPRMDGFAVLGKLRECQSTALTPFIFLTAKSSRGDVRSGMNLGADDYLTKPFTAVELLTAVQSRLNRQTHIESHVARQLEDAHQQIQQATKFHNLTGLPNRQKMWDELNPLFEGGPQDQNISILVFDIDRFHQFNDALGPEFGDELIKIVAERLQRALPDGVNVFHQVGDRFIITVTHDNPPGDVAQLAEELLSAVKLPVRMRNHEFRVSASAGIAAFPDDAATLDELLQNAELALIQAKQMGGDVVRHFNPALRNEAMDRIRLKSDLFEALNRREMFLTFQPQIRIDSGDCIGMEALLRWRHPDYGLVSPGIFIPLAEESGMIVPIGKWVMREAIAFLKILQDRGWSHHCVSINVSGRQLSENGFIPALEEELQKTGLPPRSVTLELTENELMKEAESTIQTLARIRGLGVQLAIDDFGTGYSSLAYLKRFQVNVLKIDRSFVRDLKRHTSDATIIEGILQIANNLNLEVVAEGVETSEQLDYLKEMKCQAAQGFYISRPVPTDEYTKFLTSRYS